jgi:hypothetical protein
MRMQQCEVRPQRQLQEILDAIELDDALAGLHHGADAGRRQDPAKSAAAGTDAFGECTLWDQLHLDFAADHYLLRDRIGADMRHNRTSDASCIDQLANAHAGPCGVVADDRQVARLALHECIHDGLGSADAHEAAEHEAGPVGDQYCRFGGRDCQAHTVSLLRP